MNVLKRFHGDFPRPVIKTNVYTIPKQFFVFFPSRRTDSSRLPRKRPVVYTTCPLDTEQYERTQTHRAAEIFNRMPVEYKSDGLFLWSFSNIHLYRATDVVRRRFVSVLRSRVKRPFRRSTDGESDGGTLLPKNHADSAGCKGANGYPCRNRCWHEGAFVYMIKLLSRHPAYPVAPPKP